MPRDANSMFVTAFAIAERLAAMRAAHREQLRDAANARRRERYAARKAAGIIPKKPTPAVDDPEPEPVHDCYCHVVTMAPCSWCEDGGTCGDPGCTSGHCSEEC